MGLLPSVSETKPPARRVDAGNLKMQRIVQNYINGNLTDAKHGAKDRPYTSVRRAFEQYGFSLLTACAITDYLKGLGSFQAAADAEFAEKGGK